MTISAPAHPFLSQVLRVRRLCGCWLAPIIASAASSYAGANTNVIRLASGWEHYRGSLGSVWEVWRGDKATDNVEWSPVTVPHCFNDRDSVDPDSRYYQG